MNINTPQMRSRTGCGRDALAGHMSSYRMQAPVHQGSRSLSGISPAQMIGSTRRSRSMRSSSVEVNAILGNLGKIFQVRTWQLPTV